jgi:hypothetical protein
MAGRFPRLYKARPLRVPQEFLLSSGTLSAAWRQLSSRDWETATPKNAKKQGKIEKTGKKNA